MSPSGQTLQDFVLSLLTDEAARSAFDADPAAALSGAGLQDITAQDVQEVVPLVLDYAPGGVGERALAESGLTSLPGDAAGAEGAIQQLQALTQVADGGELPELPRLEDLTASSFAEETPLGSIAGAHEITPEGLAATGAYAGELLSGSVAGDAAPEGAAGAAGATTEAANLGGSVSGSAAGAAASGGIASEPLSAGFASAGGVDGVNAAYGAASPLGDLGGDLFTSGQDFAGSLNIAGQEYSFDSDALGDLGGNHLAGLGDTSALDSAAMPRSGEEAASATSGTLAGYVSTGGEWLAGGAAAGGHSLGGYLTGALPAEQVDAVDVGTETLSDQIAAGTGQLAGHLENLPMDLPELPTEAPEVYVHPPAGLPEVSVPAELPADLPPELPVDLPDLPELPVANPLPGQSGGGVSDSPLGQLNPGQHLPDLGDLTGGLLDF